MDKKNYSADDGFYELSYQPDGVYLTVYPPTNNGKRVEVEEILERLEKKGVIGFERKVVEEAVAAASKTGVKIAEPQNEFQVNAAIITMISPDKLKGYITIVPPDGGRMLTYSEIMDELSRNGIVYGIDKDLVNKLANFPVYNETICIAEGVPPIHGKDGKIEFFFNIEKEHKPTILDDGRVDYRELDLIENVKAGQKLCTIIPPVPGVPGKTVTGGEMPAVLGKKVPIPRGKNTVLSEDGLNLYSAVDGQVTYIDNKVNVFTTYEVPADVDNSTGNISFIGNVVVRGNVLSGFTIEAGGNVEVYGVVEGATIKAGGDIILRRGIQGMGKGLLVCENDVVSRYIENCAVEAGRNIVSEAIMHSHVKCGNIIELKGRKGLLVGGTARASKEISAKVIGSPMATITEVEVGANPELRERYKTIKEEIAQMENDLNKARQAINILKKLEAIGKLTDDKRDIYAKSIRTEIFLKTRLQQLKDEMQEIEGKLQRDVFGKIRVSNVAYNGVKIIIGTSMMFVREELKYCTIYRDGADIRVGAYDRSSLK